MSSEASKKLIEDFDIEFKTNIDIDKFQSIKVLLVIPELLYCIKNSEIYHTDFIKLLKKDVSRFEHRAIIIFLLTLFLQYDITGIWNEGNEQTENDEVALLLCHFLRNWDNFTVFYML